MLFSSITFLYFFLPVTLVISFLAPKKYKNLVLLVASFFFYAWGSLRYCALLAIAILLGYGAGLLLDRQKVSSGKEENSNQSRREDYKTSEKKARQKIVGITIGLLAGSLIICKYVPWLSGIGNRLTEGWIPAYNWILPIGISFYTFQIISYVYDVYAERIPAERSLVKLATYISMFPQLIAGPIVRYEMVRGEMNHRVMTWDQFALGVRRFIIGLSKKVLLADVLGELVASLGSMEGKDTVMYWVWLVAFPLQLYLDFSGYSDMAIGLGHMLGFRIPENFRYPFLSKSITEFWRRWHISLSSWFRDYVYIPLGGNRVRPGRWMCNMLLVWGLSGLWHGAGWNFLVWGLYFGVWLVLEKRCLASILTRLPSWLLHIYTLLVVMISFAFFQMDSLQEAFQAIAGLLGFGVADAVTARMGHYQIRNYLIVLVISGVASTPVSAKLVEYVEDRGYAAKLAIKVLEPLVLLCLLILVTAFLLNSTFHPFLYFRF